MVLTARLPFPRRSGFDFRALANVRALADSHNVGVFALYSDRPDSRADSAGFVVRVSRRFTSEVMARLGSSSLEWLRDADGHPSDRWYTDGVMSEISSFVTELGARLVVVETLWLQRYIAPLRGLGCRVVLDAHGLEGALHEELAEAARNPLTRRFAERTTRLEAAAFVASDQVWIPSAREAELARERCGTGVALVVVPNVIDVEEYWPAAPRTEEFVVVFPGAFGAPQNANAARRLSDGIFPALTRRLPNARLVLVGRDPTPEMQAAADRDPRIQVTGRVADASTYIRRASVMSVPLREGHGTRFKVLEAFASRVPVVSTMKGVEGIDVVPGEHYLAAESDEEFVDTLARLAANPLLGEQLLADAFELVRAHYSIGRVTEIVTGALAAEAVG